MQREKTKKANKLKQIKIKRIEIHHKHKMKQTSEKVERDRPEFHVQGSTVPSMHCQPESLPDLCESRCTPSFSSGRKSERRITNRKYDRTKPKKKEDGNGDEGVYEDAFF